jgi:hypothetical protein
MFLAPFFMFAQIGQNFSIAITPTNPGPNETVNFSLSAYEFNIDLAGIVWNVDGKPVKSGVGQTSFSMTSPLNGKSATISAVVTPVGGSALTNSVTISPADMDVLYEVIDGYVPPFYRGKTLPIKQSQIKVVAVPHVKTVSGSYARPEDFVYTWRKDGQNVPSQSGIARDSLIFANQILDKDNVVSVSATNGSKTVGSNLTLKMSEPEIIFYEEYSIEGVQYQRALSNVSDLKKPRLTVVAEPYFLSSDFKTNQNIIMGWQVNGVKADNKFKQSITLNTLDRVGLVTLTASYNDTKKLFREITNSMKITNN